MVDVHPPVTNARVAHAVCLVVNHSARFFHPELNKPTRCKKALAEARAKDKKALAEALAWARELELLAASVAALGLSTAAAGGGELLDLADLALAGEDLEDGDLAGEDLAGEDLVELLAGKDVPEDLPEDEPEAVPEGPVFERGESVRIVLSSRGHFPGATPSRQRLRAGGRAGLQHGEARGHDQAHRPLRAALQGP